MRFAIFGQYYQNNTASIVKKVIGFLQKKEASISFYEPFLKKLQENNISISNVTTFKEHTELVNHFDFLISIGGDGTILRAATFIRNTDIPIIGINAGRLGFLATVQEEDLDTRLEQVFQKKYEISRRNTLEIISNQENQDLENINFALNEITVSRKDTTSMITIETYINNEYLTSYWADGLIISSPTGSTGYSLSCGGPVIMPNAECFVITPIAPHNLTARPLVIPNHVTITLKVSGRESQYLVSLDSRITSVNNDSVLTIKKSNIYIDIISFPEEGFLKTIRKKLLWGEDKRN
jgi:NAD+ kinase